MRALFQERCRKYPNHNYCQETEEEFIETSSMLTQVKDEKLGGVKGGGK